jgi:hypothetical protein
MPGVIANKVDSWRTLLTCMAWTLSCSGENRLPSMPDDAKSTRCGTEASDAELKLWLSSIVILLPALLKQGALCSLVVNVQAKGQSRRAKLSLIEALTIYL